MEVAYDIWNPEIGMTDGIISRFLRRVSERSPKKRRSFVMKEMYARDYRIYEERAQVEIRDGFNSNPEFATCKAENGAIMAPFLH